MECIKKSELYDCRDQSLAYDLLDDFKRLFGEEDLDDAETEPDRDSHDKEFFEVFGVYPEVKTESKYYPFSMFKNTLDSELDGQEVARDLFGFINREAIKVNR